MDSSGTAPEVTVLDRHVLSGKGEFVAAGADQLVAARIAACVNACRGIPTSELEAGVLTDLLAHCDQALTADVGKALLRRIRGAA